MGIPAKPGVSASGLPPLGDQANAVLSGVLTGVGVTPPFAFRGPLNLCIYASLVATLTTAAGSLAATLNSAAGLAAGDSISSANLPSGSVIGALAGTNVTLGLAPRTQTGVFGPTGLLTGMFATDRNLGATITIPQSAAEQVALPAGTVIQAIVQQNVPATDNSPGVLGVVQLSNNPTLLPVAPLPVPFLESFTGNAVLVTGADAAATFTGAAVNYVGTVQLERSFDGGSTWIVCNIGATGTLAQWTAGTPVSLTFGEPEKQVLYRLNCTAYTSGNINYRFSQTGGAAESLAIGPLTNG